jgi:hypothetical protein
MDLKVVEYVGLNHEALSLIEGFRQAPTETRCDIIIRCFSLLQEREAESTSAPIDAWFDLGEGARVRVGEKLFLYLSKKDAAHRGHPDAVIDVRADGLYMEGKKLPLSRRGNSLDPAMKLIQERKNHRNEKGELVSLSAWRQWFVIRDGKLISMLELKDPALARTRGRYLDLTPEQVWGELTRVDQMPR